MSFAHVQQRVSTTSTHFATEENILLLQLPHTLIGQYLSSTIFESWYMSILSTRTQIDWKKFENRWKRKLESRRNFMKDTSYYRNSDNLISKKRTVSLER